MYLINFLDWFETCPAWQALAVGLAGVTLLLAAQRLLGRLLAPAHGGRALRAY